MLTHCYIQDASGSQSPTRPAPKKRGRAKKEEDVDDAEAGEPPVKKAKATAKKGRSIKEEELEADDAAAAELLLRCGLDSLTTTCTGGNSARVRV